MNRPAPLRSIIATITERRPIKIGGATVDPASRDACWAGGQERLQPQTLKVLIALISRQGEVVTRDELVELCWERRIVGDDVINRSISLLRRFAKRAGGFKIETVPRAGYRLVETKVSKKRTNVWVALAIAVFSAVSILSRVLNHPTVRQGMPPAPTIAIGYFNSDGNDVIARQVARAVPVSLSHMLSESGVPVLLASSDSLKKHRAEFVLSGIVRRGGTGLEATVHLDQADSGRMAFSHNFSARLDESNNLPDQIGAAVAADLAWTGAKMALDLRHPLNPQDASELMEALTLTIEAREGLRSYQIARRIAPMEPNSAIAQLELAFSTSFLLDSIPIDERADAVNIALRASDRAQSIAPDFGDVYVPACILHSPVRMVECDALLRKAMRIDPITSFVPGYLSTLLFNAGRIREAVELARVSLANDPYKPAKLARMIRMLEISGNAEESDRLFQEATRLWPDQGRLLRSRLSGLAERGDYPALEREIRTHPHVSYLEVPALKTLLQAHRSRDRARADKVCDVNERNDFTLSLCMTVLADLGDLDGSYAIAKKLYPALQAPRWISDDQVWLQNPRGFNTAVLSAPAAKAMRADRRFIEITQKLGLSAYWRKDGFPDYCRTPSPEPVCSLLPKAAW